MRDMKYVCFFFSTDTENPNTMKPFSESICKISLFLKLHELIFGCEELRKQMLCMHTESYLGWFPKNKTTEMNFPAFPIGVGPISDRRSIS